MNKYKDKNEPTGGLKKMAGIKADIIKIKDEIQKGVALDGLKESTKRLIPSHKTILTLAWIMVSIMIGEFIIYNHQNIFSSYVISASDFTTGSGIEKISNREGRDQYEKQINSSENFYKKILTRYTGEDGTKSVPAKTIAVSARTSRTTAPAKITTQALKPVPVFKPAVMAKQSPRRTATTPVSKIASPKPAAARNNDAIIAEDTPETPAIKAKSGNAIPKFIVHRVKNGETLSQISKEYFKTTSKYRQIAKQNKLNAPFALKEGEKLIIMLN